MAEDAVKCAVCKDLSPQVKCYCMETPISLCSTCSVSHFLATGELPHRPFPVEHSAPDYEACEVCRISAAQSICTCMFPWISYCSDCASAHVSSDMGHSKHSLEPLYAKFYLQSSTNLAGYYERQRFADELRAEVMKNQAAVDQCIAEVNKLALELITSVEGWRTNTVHALQQVKVVVHENVQICCAQIDAMRYELSITPRMRIDQLIQLGSRANLEEAKQEMVMLRYSLDAEKAIKQLPFVFSFIENYLMLEAVDKILFAVPKTNKIVEFELPDMSPHELTLATDVKFRSFSAWCKLPSGEILVTGGLVQKDGDKYYRDAVVLDCSAKTLRPAPSMRKERCRHGIVYYHQFVYVFGGYCDEYLKSCERYNLRTQQWSALPDLKDARDCVSASVWKERIYIVGYASSRIEVLDVASETFSVFPVSLRMSLMNLLVPKHCALVSADNGELTVVMETEVLKVSIEGRTARSVRLPTKVEKAWYSPCPPAVSRGEFAFFFTLDMELWRLHVPTSELKFIHKLK